MLSQDCQLHVEPINFTKQFVGEALLIAYIHNIITSHVIPTSIDELRKATQPNPDNMRV